MKKSFLFYAVVLFLCSAAQPPASPVPDKPFYTVSYAAGIQEMRIDGDSLRLLDARSKASYHIEGSEKKGAYEVLYVQRNFLIHPKIPIESYGLFVFRISPDKDTLQLFENSRWFFTPEEAKKAVDAVASFEEQYFDVYYSQPAFARLRKYRQVKSADRPTLQAITDQWAAAINDNKQKALSTTNDGVVYGHRAWQSELTPLLVKYRLDPVIPIKAYNAQAKRSGVVFPASVDLRQGAHTVKVTDTVTDSVREIIRTKPDSTR